MRNSRTSVLAVLALAASVAFTGCGKGSSKNIRISGVDGPRVNFVDNKLTMAVVLKDLSIDFGTRIQIPHMPQSFLEVGPDFQSNGYLISIGLDADDIKALAGGGVTTLDPTTLPGGRPLPGVMTGQLPGMAVQIPNWHDLVFYVGPAVFGVFVPVKLPLKDFIGTYRFYDGTGEQVGNISVVGTDASGENSGMLLLINLRGKVGKLIAMTP